MKQFKTKPPTWSDEDYSEFKNFRRQLRLWIVLIIVFIGTLITLAIILTPGNHKNAYITLSVIGIITSLIAITASTGQMQELKNKY